ncbi:MAG: hypothetical protein FWE90_09045 [Defluviitaleaceae bacterium]|nr:hypothetical protein [Defluviitaleaceae bacterium]
MGGFFNFSLWDVINHPAIRTTYQVAKLGVKAISSASAKAEYNKITVSDIAKIKDDALNGDSNAELMVAMYYTQEDDFDRGLYWLERSAKHGNEQAKAVLDMLQT